MWELDYKESWAPKNWCFWTVVLEKTLESPLDCKEIQPVNPKGNQSWIFIGRTDVEAETPILWPPDAKSWLIWKDDAGRDWRQEEKETKEDEMVGWHHWLDGRLWATSGSWWWTGKPDVLQSRWSQRVGHCRELPGCAQSMARSWDERGACKAALPLGVVLGAQSPSSFCLTVVGFSINSRKCNIQWSGLAGKVQAYLEMFMIAPAQDTTINIKSKRIRLQA